MAYQSYTPPEPPKNEMVALALASTPTTLPRFFGKCLEQPISQAPSIVDSTKAASGPAIEPKGDAILTVANGFDLVGTLKMDKRGFIYLDLPDTFITELLPLLDNDEVVLPPYFSGDKSYGAHVSVVHASEDRLPHYIDYLDQAVEFTITGCYSVAPRNWQEMERVWFLTVDAPILSEIRTSLGLSPKIHDHEFHITIGVKPQFLTLEDVMAQQEESRIVLGTGVVTRSRIRDLKNASNKA